MQFSGSENHSLSRMIPTLRKIGGERGCQIIFYRTCSLPWNQPRPESFLRLDSPLLKNHGEGIPRGTKPLPLAEILVKHRDEFQASEVQRIGGCCAKGLRRKQGAQHAPFSQLQVKRVSTAPLSFRPLSLPERADLSKNTIMTAGGSNFPCLIRMIASKTVGGT